MSENGRLDNKTEYQIDKTREGGEYSTPSLVTNETIQDIAGQLALFGMDVDLRTFSPLALAFLGDAVYSLIIRTSVLARGNRQAEKLHNETTRLVRAQKQAAIGRAVYDLLTLEEQKVYRRGRNSHPMQALLWMNTCRRPPWRHSAAISICRAGRNASWKS